MKLCGTIYIYYGTQAPKLTAYLIRNSRDSTPVHEEQVHPLHVLPPPPPPLNHWLAIQYSVEPHLTSKTWRHCRRRTLLAVNYCVKF